MSSFDTGYVRAESDFRAQQIREGIVGRRQKTRLWRSRPHGKRGTSTEVL
jgi:hypothetical protein